MKFERRTLGILGGGQLGRMSALAAARLGIVTHIYTPETDSPASQVSAITFVGAYEDHALLKEFAESVDVISYEFENIPVETVQFLRTIKPVYPDDRLLAVSQHRCHEKQFLNDLGIATAGWARIGGHEEIEPAARSLGGDGFILKTARFGYDGKGQSSYRLGDDPVARWQALGEQELILEQKVDFTCEISTIVARDLQGGTVVYGPILNRHKDGILDRSTYPAGVAPQVEADARRAALKLADAVGLVGVLTLEMFVTPDQRIIANEIAPRTHNSGHLTIDACTCSQFEQHVRTVCGLPVGDPHFHSAAFMINLIGDDVHDLARWAGETGCCLHLYGKAEARPARKMGHVTLLDFDKPETGH